MQPTIRQQDDLEEENSERTLTPHELQLKAQEEKELEIVTGFYNKLKELNPEAHPSFDELKTWKNTYGRIYFAPVVDLERIFIWRPIYRQEWKEFISLYGNATELDRQEGLLKKCLLFPPAEVVLEKCPAGYLPSLETQIMYQSGFVSDNMLLSSIEVIK